MFVYDFHMILFIISIDFDTNLVCFSYDFDMLLVIVQIFYNLQSFSLNFNRCHYECIVTVH